MKTKILILTFIFAHISIFSQLDWNTAGNTATPTSILGTLNPQPLNIFTENIQRAELSQTENINVSGWSIPHGGYLGLSDQANFFTKGPFSMIHINGGNGTGAPQESGFRTWMKYGTIITANTDLVNWS